MEALEAHDARKPSSGSSRRNKKRKKKKLPRGGRAHRRQRQWYFHGKCLRCVPSVCRQAQAAGHHGRYAPEGQLCALFFPAVACARLVLRVFCTSRGFQAQTAARSQTWPVWTRGTVKGENAEAHSHGLVDHGDSTVSVLGQGDRCPSCPCRSGSS